jgi:hypothetical protein
MAVFVGAPGHERAGPVSCSSTHARCIIDANNRLEFEQKFLPYESIDHQNRIGWKQWAFKDLGEQFAPQAHKFFYILAMYKEGREFNNIVEITSKASEDVIQVGENLVKLFFKIILPNDLALHVYRQLSGNKDQTAAL